METLLENEKNSITHAPDIKHGAYMMSSQVRGECSIDGGHLATVLLQLQCVISRLVHSHVMFT